MTDQVRQEVRESMSQGSVRLVGVLEGLGIAPSSWYRPAKPATQRQRPGPQPVPIPEDVRDAVVRMATDNPWYGYKKIAVMCRRAPRKVTDRQVYRVMRAQGLLQRRRSRDAELYQSAKLWELLPQKPNDLWQMDVTYIHIPGHGWHYAVTVIDYYSRYLLACRLTTSYSAIEAVYTVAQAKQEAELLGRPLNRPAFLVTDNGSSFTARRFASAIEEAFQHVRIRYRTPTQLGLLERFHQTLKTEEVYWRLYDDPWHARRCLAEFRKRYNERRPHWALVPTEGGDPLVPEEVYVGGREIQIPRWQAWAKAAKAKLDAIIAGEVA